MYLNTLIDEKNIFFDLDLKTKSQVFQFLADKLYRTGYIDSVDEFVKAVEYRETLSETGLGEGIAIPHGKALTVKKPGIAFIRLKEPIYEWETLDDVPIRFIFLLAISQNNENNEHIRMLSELARCLIRKNVIEKIKSAANASELLDILSEGGNLE